MFNEKNFKEKRDLFFLGEVAELGFWKKLGTYITLIKAV